MPESATKVLATSAARTTTGTTGEMRLIEKFTSAIVRLDVTAASGTSPTLNFRVQQGILDDAAATFTGAQPPAGGSITWDDFMSFTQMTTTGTRYWRIVAGGNVEAAASAAALSAGSIRSGPLGALWRGHWTIGGTNPSFTFDVTVQLIA